MSNTTLGLSSAMHDYLLDISVKEHPVATALRERTSTMEMANMQIAPEQGQFIQFLLTALNAKKTLEIGTFTGYSALITALSLPEDGKLISCDISDEWTKIGEAYWQQAGVNEKIDLRIAPAIQTLDELESSGHTNSFDFIFIDADKINYLNYYEAALRLIKKSGLIVIDNIFWGGKVADVNEIDEDTQAIKALNMRIKNDERVFSCALPIADGLFLVQPK
jgi:predicted O-methyltransferase YrrM